MPIKKKIIIAIDGHSSCGKSTLAKSLAKHLDYVFVDTGAMYRAVTLHLLDLNIDISDQTAVASELNDITISFIKKSDQNITILNDREVEQEIRTTRVANKVSEVSALQSVREFLKVQQQNLGTDKGVVMDGRDIGTVIFPQAELKLFVTASLAVRSQRRYDELKEKGMEVSLQIVNNNLQKRDKIDSSREHAPLLKAVDAIEIDTSNMTKEEQFELALQFAISRLKNLVFI